MAATTATRKAIRIGAMGRIRGRKTYAGRVLRRAGDICPAQRRYVDGRLTEGVNFGSLLRWMPYRPTERTEQRKAEVRERILAAAMEQLAEGGYASASIQAVAKRAQVATGTLYRHFPS